MENHASRENNNKLELSEIREKPMLLRFEDCRRKRFKFEYTGKNKDG